MDLKTAELAASAAIKMANGALMTIEEVGARLSISPMTVHKMPLPSIRLGRLLRFEPRAVAALIDASREATTAEPQSNAKGAAHPKFTAFDSRHRLVPFE